MHIILVEDICEGTALYLSLMGETISLLVIFVLSSSLPTSSGEMTGKGFGFLAPLCFLLKFTSSKPGDRISALVNHLYPRIFRDSYGPV